MLSLWNPRKGIETRAWQPTMLPSARCPYGILGRGLKLGRGRRHFHIALSLWNPRKGIETKKDCLRHVPLLSLWNPRKGIETGCHPHDPFPGSVVPMESSEGD